MNEEKKEQVPQKEGQQDIEANRNTTLQDPGASVADYGRSGTTNGEGLDQQRGTGQQDNGRKGEEGTIGIP